MAIEVVTEITDGDGDKSSTSIWVQTGTTLVQLLAFAPLWATALNDMISGKIRAMFAVVPASTVTITDNSGALTSDVEHVAKFQFRVLSNPQVRVNVNIPALDETAMDVSTTDLIDQADTEVAAFIAAMESGIAVTGGTISPCDIGEGQITEVIFAREGFNNSGARR